MASGIDASHAPSDELRATARPCAPCGERSERDGALRCPRSARIDSSLGLVAAAAAPLPIRRAITMIAARAMDA